MIIFFGTEIENLSLTKIKVIYLKLNFMKKIFLGAAIAMSSLAFAQTFGVKGGANFSSVNGGGTFNDSKGKVGFYAGAFVNAPIAEKISIQPEVVYNNLGARIANNSDYKLNMDYISIPVMFQYNATPELYLEAGPQFSFLVNSKFSGPNTTFTNLVNQFNKKENYNSFDFGLGLGAGYYFTQNIGITARYVAGFTDISKNNAFGSDAKAKNNNFQVGLAYKF